MAPRATLTPEQLRKQVRLRAAVSERKIALEAAEVARKRLERQAREGMNWNAFDAAARSAKR